MRKSVVLLLVSLGVILTLGVMVYGKAKEATGMAEGAKWVIEGCYNKPDGAALLNGDTGHAMICGPMGSSPPSTEQPPAQETPSQAPHAAGAPSAPTRKSIEDIPPGVNV